MLFWLKHPISTRPPLYVELKTPGRRRGREQPPIKAPHRQQSRARTARLTARRDCRAPRNQISEHKHLQAGSLLAAASGNSRRASAGSPVRDLNLVRSGSKVQEHKRVVRSAAKARARNTQSAIQLRGWFDAVLQGSLSMQLCR